MSHSGANEKLQIVVDALKSNPDVVLAGGIEVNYLQDGQQPYTPHGWARTIDIYTYPRLPIYSADALNDFMHSLVPGLEPTMVDKFRSGSTELALGKLYYDESIGKVMLASTVQLEEGLSVVRNGILPVRWKVPGQVLDLRQRTWVRVFPDEGHLWDAAEGNNEYGIPLGELGKSAGKRVVAHLLENPLFGKVIDDHPQAEP